MRMHKTSFIRSAALGAASLLVLTASVASGSPSPRDELAAWAGHWKIRIETRETKFSHANTEDFDAKCSFLPHRTFIACEYLSLPQNPSVDHIINDVSLIYYSDVDKTFKYTNVAPEGGPSENVMSVNGTVWTRPFEIPTKSAGIIDAREIYDYVSPEKHLARLEVSTDKGAHWILVNEAVGTKEP